MTVTIPHELSKQEAGTRIRNILDGVKTQFGSSISGLEEEWTEETGKFKFSMSGQPVSGSLQLLEKAVQVDIKLPIIATMFKGKIKSMIEEQGAKLLS